MMAFAPLRRQLALFLCPELSAAPETPDDPRVERVWESNWRPDWWFHLEARAFAISSRGRMTITDCAHQGHRRFGTIFPSKSAIHRLWRRLDVLDQQECQR